MSATSHMDPHDDPRLTAYALGECDATERAAIEARLATDADARAVVEEVRSAGSRLTSALATEPAPGLTPESKAAVARAASGSVPLRRLHLVRGGRGFAAAAVLLVGFAILGFAILVPPDQSSRGYSPPPEGAAVYASVPPQSRTKHRDSQWKRYGYAPAVASGPAEQSAHTADVTRLQAEREARLGGVTPGLPRGPSLDPSAGAGFTDGALESPGGGSGEAYDHAKDNDFVRVADEPLSTFSLDVDTAAYANVRRMLVAGSLPPPGAVRVEELLNYFPYAYAPPIGGVPFRVHLEVAACPWNLEHRFVRIGVKGREIERAVRPASNLVFLIDVSGSMNDPAKLPLVKASLRMLVDELNERDRVAIVVYAGASGLVLPSTSCERKAEIQQAIDTLTPGGSTNGAAGIGLAYEVATKEFLPGGTNRVVLCTDGDWNVGVTSQDELVRLIEDKAKSKVFLTVLGFGMGNYKDSMLVKLAGKGNGNYGYIDTTKEAHKVLVEQAGGTLVAIAKDVKVQVEFNPAKVGAYRLIGYEKRLLAKQDFNDDAKDAGEIGAGHTVTALYEIAPPGKAIGAPPVDPLEYQPGSGSPAGSGVPGAGSDQTLTVKVRYKEPTGDTSSLLKFPLTDLGARYENASADFKFQAAVAAFGMLLRKSAFAGNASFEAVIELASEGSRDDPGGYRREFIDLAAKARELSGSRR